MTLKIRKSKSLGSQDTWNQSKALLLTLLIVSSRVSIAAGAVCSESVDTKVIGNLMKALESMNSTRTYFKDNYIYFQTDLNRIIKITPSYEMVWQKQYSGTPVFTDNNIYMHQ